MGIARDGEHLQAWRPTSQAAALGLSVEYLSKKPAFASLRFGDWSQVLFQQVAREHFVFVVDAEQRIQGFLGWALTDEGMAQQWAEGRAVLRNEDSQRGDCVIVNAFATDNTAARRFLVDVMRGLFGGKTAIYFKRRYPDGRMRTRRLTPNAFVGAHRTAARERL